MFDKIDFKMNVLFREMLFLGILYLILFVWNEI